MSNFVPDFQTIRSIWTYCAEAGDNDVLEVLAEYIEQGTRSEDRGWQINPIEVRHKRELVNSALRSAQKALEHYYGRDRLYTTPAEKLSQALLTIDELQGTLHYIRTILNL